MSLFRFAALVLALSVVPACGDDSSPAPGDNGDDTSADDDTDGTGSTKDAGKKDAGSMKDASSPKDAGPAKDAAPAGDAGSATDASTTLDASTKDAGKDVGKDAATQDAGKDAAVQDAGKDAATEPPKDAGGPSAMCQNQLCFDVFDCYIYASGFSCGYTACDGFVCK